MKEKILKIVPAYGVIPVLAVFAFNLITYYGTKIIDIGRLTHDVSIGLDSQIPLLTPFMLIYLLAFVEWVIGYVMIARDSVKLCYWYIPAELIAKFICLVIFIVYPTAMARPEVAADGFFNWMTSIVYYVDTPTDLFPSIHVLESYLIARASLDMEKVGKDYKIFVWVFFALVAVGVLFVKQHLVLDVLAGIVVAEIGIVISRKLKLWTRRS